MDFSSVALDVSVPVVERHLRKAFLDVSLISFRSAPGAGPADVALVRTRARNASDGGYVGGHGRPPSRQQVDTTTRIPGSWLTGQPRDTLRSVPAEPHWLTPQEDRAWRAFRHARHHLGVRTNRHLLEDSGLTEADYVVLAVLSEYPTGRLPARQMCLWLQWEKSRLAHQVRRMEERGLIAREPNPADARSVLICLLPAGRRTIVDAAPQHVHNVRRHFIDLFTPAELEILADLNERILRHLAEEPFPEQSDLDS